MADAFICDYVRTPIGRFGGVLSAVRTDDLGAVPIRSLMERNTGVDWEAVEDVYYGCANQAGEDNRNVARMCSLLAGLPVAVPGTSRKYTELPSPRLLSVYTKAPSCAGCDPRPYKPNSSGLTHPEERAPISSRNERVTLCSRPSDCRVF